MDLTMILKNGCMITIIYRADMASWKKLAKVGGWEWDIAKDIWTFSGVALSIIIRAFSA